jgi:hypothetical protein
VKKWPAAVYMSLFALAAAFRFLALKNGFVNDHFVHISGGRQMLFGEWPRRDWIDPGLPLMFGASALAQAVFGSTLFAEAMLVSLAFAPLTDVRVNDEQTIHILVNRDMPAAGRDAETGWPCFRSQAAETQSHPSS